MKNDISGPGGDLPRSRVAAQALLDETIDRIRRSDGADTELLDILAKHIITLSPAKDAVDRASKDIEALAIKRGS